MRDCTYCGSILELGRDHVVPSAYTHIVRTFSSVYTVCACRECNSLLGDVMILTVPERAQYLAKTYKKRYKKLLKMPDWKESELEEVGPRFVDTILTGLAQRDSVKLRIANCVLVAREGVEKFTGDPTAFKLPPGA